MKVIVFSDSHNRNINMIKALKLHPDAEYILHLGDGINDAPRELSAKYKCVNGNCEDGFFGFGRSPGFELVEICGIKIFMCHGHMHDVKYGLSRLIKLASELGADAALYGHTHQRHNEYVPADEIPNGKKGLYVFNPGSITLPRDGKPPSYGLIEIKENGILLSHGEIPR